MGPTPGTLAPPPAGGPPASFGLDFFFVVGAAVLVLRICPSGPIFDCAGIWRIVGKDDSGRWWDMLRV